jgi:hypothetical protein
MAQNTGAGQTFTTDNQVGRRTFIGTTTPAYPVAGDVWIDNSAGSAPNANFTTYTATGGETSVTVTYTVGFELVYLNGVKLVRGSDYVATNGTSITGLTALVASDIVEVVSFTSFLVNGAVNLSTVTAKGDILAATGNSTITNVAVGSDGQTLVADSSASTGLRYTAGTVQANPVLNSAMQVWQRGTSFATTAATYTADRWYAGLASAGTVSRQTTSDTTNLPFIQYCARFARTATSASTTALELSQSFESVNSIPFAGKTVTYSFYARAGANYSPTSGYLQVVLKTGTGTDQKASDGYTGSILASNTNVVLTTTWQRFSVSATLASTATEIGLMLIANVTGIALAADYFEVTGVQLDVGSVALPFRTFSQTLQGELAACQRYYSRFTAGGAASYWRIAMGQNLNTTQSQFVFPLGSSMRAVPSFNASGSFTLRQGDTSLGTNAPALQGDGSTQDFVGLIVAMSGGTVGYGCYLRSENNTSTYLEFSAEL